MLGNMMKHIQKNQKPHLFIFYNFIHLFADQQQVDTSLSTWTTYVMQIIT